MGSLLFLPEIEGFSASSPRRQGRRKRSSSTKSLKDLEDMAFAQGETLLPQKRCFDGDSVLRNFTNASEPKSIDLVPNAPQLIFSKYMTMQEKRVIVSFRFTNFPYLRPYFLTFSSKLKKLHTDIILEQTVLPVVDPSAQPIFEVYVDGKIVIGGGGSNRERHILGGRVDVQNTQSVFVSMEQLGLAILKARRKRRPTALYGEDDDDREEWKKHRYKRHSERHEE